jgi:hypothetical protein
MSDAAPPNAENAPEWMPRVRTAKRHVRSMDAAQGEGGGSQPQVLQDSEGESWMVKAANNPQGLRVLVNEYVAAALGARLAAAVQEGAVVSVPAELAQSVTHSDGTHWTTDGAFGSRLLDSAAPYTSDMLPSAANAVALARTVGLDTWLGQHDGRQARAIRCGDGYEIRAVDFGHGLGPPNWTAADLVLAAALFGAVAAGFSDDVLAARW